MAAMDLLARQLLDSNYTIPTTLEDVLAPLKGVMKLSFHKVVGDKK